MAGMKSNLRETLEIAATVSDPRIKLQARAIANDCYKFILDMSTNAGIVSDALKYVTQQKEQVNALQKLEEQLTEEEGEATNQRDILESVYKLYHRADDVLSYLYQLID